MHREIDNSIGKTSVVPGPSSIAKANLGLTALLMRRRK
jgi:hypothetical protein